MQNSLHHKPWKARYWVWSLFFSLHFSPPSKMEASLGAGKRNPFTLQAAARSKYPGQPVRAIPVRVLTVSKKRSQGVQLLVDEYKEKVKHYCSMEIVHIKSNPKNTSDVKAQIEGEDMLVMQNIKPEDLVIMLDERGKDIGSKEMAELVGDAGRTGASRLVFCIGGPYGHGSQLRARADVAVRLSSMVLNHQIALLSMDHSQRTKVSSLDACKLTASCIFYLGVSDEHHCPKVPYVESTVVK
ncbi:hypothetical protein Taro_017698 [Colocasia esculenta]|uniref:RNA methyltransferase n=1 Tax=Colocasia esculenta TaxID=4460 RepID=A0A843UNS9_COLES|nr:hypothetical protein [Colocasia esculenta]